jgi:hypothetical protein
VDVRDLLSCWRRSRAEEKLDAVAEEAGDSMEGRLVVEESSTLQSRGARAGPQV